MAAPVSGLLTEEYDPAYLRFGSKIMIRSDVKLAGCIRMARPANMGPDGGEPTATTLTSDVTTGGVGVGHVSETFLLVNPDHRSSDRVIMFTDAICFKSIATGKYLSPDAESGLPRAKRDTIGQAEKWTIVPSTAPSAAGSVGGIEAVLARMGTVTTSAAPTLPRYASRGDGASTTSSDTTLSFADGAEGVTHAAVRACAPVCIRSYTKRFLGVSRHDPAVPFEVSIGSLKALSGTAADPSFVWSLVFAHATYSPPWTLTRPYLTGEVLLHPAVERAQSLGVKSAPRPLSAFPIPIQEEILVQDVLDAMIGCDGRYICCSHTIEGGISQFHSLEDVAFELDPKGTGNPVDADATFVDASLAFLTKRILEVAVLYVKCCWYVERRSSPESGLTAQALAAAAKTYINDHLLTVLQLEDRANSTESRLTLQELWYSIQPTRERLKSLDDILSAAPNAIGCALLNSVHKFASQCGNAQTQSMATFLLQAASQPMLSRLEKWLYHGVVDDPHQEFMVFDHVDISKDTMTDDYNAVYWDKRYTVRGHQVPTYLAHQADVILTTGKYLNALRQCGLTISSPEAGPVPFTLSERDYDRTITRAYRFSATALLQHLMSDVKLLDRLACLRNYFLLQQADFIGHFMDVADEELRKPVDGSDIRARNTTTQRLLSLLELGIRSSSAASDPYKDDVSCVLERSGLIDQLDAIHNLAGGVGDSLLRPAVPVTSSELTGYHVFTLDYEVKWPLSIVLSRRALTKYQLQFRHLFYCRFVERELCNSWSTLQCLKDMNLHRLFSGSYILRHRMFHFVHNLYYYMAIEVVQPKWHEMIDELKKAATVDEVVKIHGEFLDGCLRECLLTNHELIKTLTRLLNLCLTFSTLIEKVSTSILEIVRPVKHVPTKPTGSKPTPTAASGRSKLTPKASSVPVVVTPPSDEDIELRMQMALTRHSFFAEVEACSKLFLELLREFMSKLLDKSSGVEVRSHTAALWSRLDYNGYYSGALRLQSSK